MFVVIFIILNLISVGFFFIVILEGPQNVTIFAGSREEVTFKCITPASPNIITVWALPPNIPKGDHYDNVTEDLEEGRKELLLTLVVREEYNGSMVVCDARDLVNDTFEAKQAFFFIQGR